MELGSDRALLRVVNEPERTLVIMQGEFDLAVRNRYHSEIARLLTEGAPVVEVDASEVEFIDSQWLSVFVLLHRRVVVEGNGVLRMSRMSPVVERVLTVAGLSLLEGFEVQENDEVGGLG